MSAEGDLPFSLQKEYFSNQFVILSLLILWLNILLVIPLAISYHFSLLFMQNFICYSTVGQHTWFFIWLLQHLLQHRSLGFDVKVCQKVCHGWSETTANFLWIMDGICCKRRYLLSDVMDVLMVGQRRFYLGNQFTSCHCRNRHFTELSSIICCLVS